MSYQDCCVSYDTNLQCRYGPGRQSRQQSLHKLGQLQQSISGWEGKDIVANCSEIVYEGKLKVCDNNIDTHGHNLQA